MDLASLIRQCSTVERIAGKHCIDRHAAAEAFGDDRGLVAKRSTPLGVPYGAMNVGGVAEVRM